MSMKVTAIHTQRSSPVPQHKSKGDSTMLKTPTPTGIDLCNETISEDSRLYNHNGDVVHAPEITMPQSAPNRNIVVVPEAGIEPARAYKCAADFKSAVSTDFTTRAKRARNPF